MKRMETRFEARFDSMEAQFDEMDSQFDSMDALFKKFPGFPNWKSPGFTNWTITYPAPAEGRQSDPRDSVEYKTFRLQSLTSQSTYGSQKKLEESLNLLGMDGWDLVAIYEGNCAIFSRVKEAAVAGPVDDGDGDGDS
jgi:hypothetical protein